MQESKFVRAPVFTPTEAEFKKGPSWYLQHIKSTHVATLPSIFIVKPPASWTPSCVIDSKKSLLSLPSAKVTSKNQTAGSNIQVETVESEKLESTNKSNDKDLSKSKSTTNPGKAELNLRSTSKTNVRKGRPAKSSKIVNQDKAEANVQNKSQCGDLDNVDQTSKSMDKEKLFDVPYMLLKGMVNNEKTYSLDQFSNIAYRFKSKLFHHPVNSISAEDVEECWRNMSAKNSLQEFSPSGISESAFPSQASLSEDIPYVTSSWNLGHLSTNDSILSLISSSTTSCSSFSPSCHVGFCLLSTDWAVPSSCLACSIGYLHWGESITFYAVENNDGKHCQSLDNLSNDKNDTFLSPYDLLAKGHKVVKARQSAGEFVVVLPRCRVMRLSHGFNLLELTQFADADWLTNVFFHNHVSVCTKGSRLFPFSFDELIVKCLTTYVIEDQDIMMSTVLYNVAFAVFFDELYCRCLARLNGIVISGTKESAIELIDVDSRRCVVCGFVCFLSICACQCGKISCAKCVKSFCSKCQPFQKSFAVRFYTNELAALVNEKLSSAVKEFRDWSEKAEAIVGTQSHPAMLFRKKLRDRLPEIFEEWVGVNEEILNGDLQDLFLYLCNLEKQGQLKLKNQGDILATDVIDLSLDEGSNVMEEQNTSSMEMGSTGTPSAGIAGMKDNIFDVFMANAKKNLQPSLIKSLSEGIVGRRNDEIITISDSDFTISDESSVKSASNTSIQSSSAVPIQKSAVCKASMSSTESSVVESLGNRSVGNENETRSDANAMRKSAEISAASDKMEVGVADVTICEHTSEVEPDVVTGEESRVKESTLEAGKAQKLQADRIQVEETENCDVNKESDEQNCIISSYSESTSDKIEEKPFLCHLKYVQRISNRLFHNSELYVSLSDAANLAKQLSVLARRILETNAAECEIEAEKEDLVTQLTLQEFMLFVGQVRALPCKIPEESDLLAVLEGAIAVEARANEMLRSNETDIKSIQRLLRSFERLPLSLPVKRQIKDLLIRRKWVDEVQNFLSDNSIKSSSAENKNNVSSNDVSESEKISSTIGSPTRELPLSPVETSIKTTSPQKSPKSSSGSNVTTESIRKLIQKGSELTVDPSVEKLLKDLISFLGRCNQVEANCEFLKNVGLGSKVEMLLIDAALEEASLIPVVLPKVKDLVVISKEAKALMERMSKALDGDEPMYLGALEKLAVKVELSPVRFEKLGQLEALIAAAKSWLEMAGKTFLFKNSSYSLYEVLSPRTDIKNSGRLGSRRRRVKPGDVNTVHHVKVSRGSYVDTSYDVTTIVGKFREANEKEMSAMIALRNTEHQESVAGRNIEFDMFEKMLRKRNSRKVEEMFNILPSTSNNTSFSLPALYLPHDDITENDDKNDNDDDDAASIVGKDRNVATCCVCKSMTWSESMLQCQLCRELYHTECVQSRAGARNVSDKSAGFRLGPRGADRSLDREISSESGAVRQHSASGGRNQEKSASLQGLSAEKYLCLACKRSNRPTLEQVLSLVVALQKLSVRIAEGEALQALADRAITWQDRARQMLDMPEISSAISRLKDLEQLRDECFSLGILNPSVVSDPMYQQNFPPHSNLQQEYPGGDYPGWKNPNEGFSIPSQQGYLKATGGASSSEHAYSNASKSQAGAAASGRSKSRQQQIIQQLSSRSDDVSEQLLYNQQQRQLQRKEWQLQQQWYDQRRKLEQVQQMFPELVPHLTLELPASLRQDIERLMVEGDLLEMTLEETKKLWLLLLSSQKSNIDIADSALFELTGIKSKTVVVENDEVASSSSSVEPLRKRRKQQMKQRSDSSWTADESLGNTQDGNPDVGIPRPLSVSSRGKISHKRKSLGGGIRGGKSGGLLGGGDQVLKQKVRDGQGKKLSRGGSKAPARGMRKSRAPKLGGPVREEDKCEDDCAAPQCLRPLGDEVDWVQCDCCSRWYHYVCEGISGRLLEDEYKCLRCVSFEN